MWFRSADGCLAISDPSCSAAEKLKALWMAALQIAKYSNPLTGHMALAADAMNHTKALGFFYGLDVSTELLSVGIAGCLYKDLTLV